MNQPLHRGHKPRPDLLLDGVDAVELDAARVDEATGLGSIPEQDMLTALRVVKAIQALPQDHADSAAFRQATASVHKQHRKDRRATARRKIQDAEAAVVAKTATGSPQRIDDETAGILISTPTVGESAGEYPKPRACYICKVEYTRVDAFYHQLCPPCAAMSHGKRDASCDLTGRRALLTGGRAKIGMYIALRLLRDGADLTITTRFPADATRRFADCEDSADWLHRLTIVGIDLRDPSQVASLAQSVAAEGPLDILINNAAQTVRRQPGSYAALAAAEAQPPSLENGPKVITFDRISEAHPAALAGALSEHPVPHLASMDPSQVSRMAVTAGHASLERHLDGTALDAGGLLPDVVDVNSWTQTMGSVDPMELLEVQLCNYTAPFILINALRPALAASAARRTYIVNVSAMEGIFSRGYKGPGHPHTNMAKAGLNMLVRTAAKEMFESDGILMTAVDTGWITDERPHTTKIRLAQEGFKAPLDLVDGAARVYDPIVQGESGTDIYGVFLKDFAVYGW